jgi:hypothetical protein
MTIHSKLQSRILSDLGSPLLAFIAGLMTFFFTVLYPTAPHMELVPIIGIFIILGGVYLIFVIIKEIEVEGSKVRIGYFFSRNDELEGITKLSVKYRKIKGSLLPHWILTITHSRGSIDVHSIDEFSDYRQLFAELEQATGVKIENSDALFNPKKA